MKPLEVLFERHGLPTQELPSELAALYGGQFGLRHPTLYANFVSSVDGIVALPISAESGALISEHDEADQFIMGLLRASADAVLIGAGTFRKAEGHRWYPESVYPKTADLFAELRKLAGLRPHPRLVVVTASGRIDTTQPALEDCLIVTTTEGESSLRERLPSGAELAVLGTGRILCQALVEFLHAEGHKVILTEGGPTLVGQLLQERLIDELFLTVSPRLFGRHSGDRRKSLVEGVDLGGRSLTLASARQRGSYLYLRYTVETSPCGEHAVEADRIVGIA
jgi:riboflavin biosynthesis pyrimidine reductase